MSSVIFPSSSNIRSVIIEDVCAFSVSGLLTKKVFDDIKVDQKSKVLVLGTELHPSFPKAAESWKSLLNHELIEYHNLINNEFDTKDGLLSNIVSTIEAFSIQNKDAIVIINITPILFTNPASKVSRLLLAIDNIKNLRLAIYGLHGDCHEIEVCTELKKLSDAVLSVTDPDFDGKGSGKCQVTTYKTRGKNSTVVSNFHINSALEFKVVKLNPSSNIQEESEDVKLETTFNLGLKLSEKKAKTEVELPFWRPEQKVNQTKSQSQKGGSSGGEIIYIADEIDDCDEEDPDDELNI